MRTLIVKLKSDVRQQDGCAWLRALIGEGDLEGVNPLFPGDAEPETASLMEVKLRDSAPIDRLLAALEQAADVEYAHETRTRRPLPRRRG